MTARAIAALAALLALFSPAASALERLDTASYALSIDVRCEEGVVGCDKVRLVATERRTGEVTRLNGREVHTRCADGVTPCRFLGYEFKRGSRTYNVWENGTFAIRQGGKVVLEEKATPRDTP